MTSDVLVAEDVAVHYGGIKAVDGIDLTLTPGRICGLLGPNGSGKSTLLAAITRLVPLTRGRLLLDGKEYHRAAPASLAKRGVARTFQTVRLLPDLTVLENVQVGADLHGRKAGGAAEAIERTGIGDVVSAWPGELSYGMARRVEIARALAMRPRLLLLDEPTAGMNQAERKEISALLRDLREEGLAQLLVEHDVQMMVDTCDDLVAMNFGAVVARGTPHEVVQNAAVREAYLGKRGRAHA
ncbi:ATP-binding cassette domain-containing protein [Amycolatopsis sp. K13G38]|uniref:ATP-binding cassette domain-containing protein n=1 Tax=Amycolatopsis acididurans TaxID=2724524 RepID=A0ABX1J7N1_9PSEU|nr:ATP-binding cassette domain-containing protein [Amycolatopsis acididurans]NKQ55800.1 ATP-binding cassette domain-containing protein [Amycolatopsis acididurans]